MRSPPSPCRSRGTARAADGRRPARARRTRHTPPAGEPRGGGVPGARPGGGRARAAPVPRRPRAMAGDAAAALLVAAHPGVRAARRVGLRGHRGVRARLGAGPLRPAAAPAPAAGGRGLGPGVPGLRVRLGPGGPPAARGVSAGAAVTFMLAAPIAMGWAVGIRSPRELLKALPDDDAGPDRHGRTARAFFEHFAADAVFMGGHLVVGAAAAATLQTFVPESVMSSVAGTYGVDVVAK